jgi:hypothetical protein
MNRTQDKTLEAVARAWSAVEVSICGMCACSMAERDSGHRVDCWYPEYLAKRDELNRILALVCREEGALREAAYYWRDYCETRVLECIPDPAERELAACIDAQRRDLPTAKGKGAAPKETGLPKRLPTIAELEAILESKEHVELEILPNGEIREKKQGSQEKGRKPLTMRENVGGEYEEAAPKREQVETSSAREHEIDGMKKTIRDFSVIAPKVIEAFTSIANELDRRRANAKPRAGGEGGRT